MNERIKELAEQAEQYANEQNDKYGARLKTEYDKKFALLIVKECLKLNSKELSITAIERLLPLDKEHFGVEE